MTVSTLIFGSICFAAGMCAGVWLCDKGYLTPEDLSSASTKAVDCAKRASRKICPSQAENSTPQQATV